VFEVLAEVEAPFGWGAGVEPRRGVGERERANRKGSCLLSSLCIVSWLTNTSNDDGLTFYVLAKKRHDAGDLNVVQLHAFLFLQVSDHNLGILLWRCRARVDLSGRLASRSGGHRWPVVLSLRGSFWLTLMGGCRRAGVGFDCEGRWGWCLPGKPFAKLQP
jgi:hypothetical protein